MTTNTIINWDTVVKSAVSFVVDVYRLCPSIFSNEDLIAKFFDEFEDDEWVKNNMGERSLFVRAEFMQYITDVKHVGACKGGASGASKSIDELSVSLLFEKISRDVLNLNEQSKSMTIDAVPAVVFSDISAMAVRLDDGQVHYDIDDYEQLAKRMVLQLSGLTLKRTSRTKTPPVNTSDIKLLAITFAAVVAAIGAATVVVKAADKLLEEVAVVVLKAKDFVKDLIDYQRKHGEA